MTDCKHLFVYRLNAIVFCLNHKSPKQSFSFCSASGFKFVQIVSTKTSLWLPRNATILKISVLQREIYNLIIPGSIPGLVTVFSGWIFFFDWRWSTGIFSLPITFWAEFGLYNRCDFTVKTRWSNSLSLTMKWLPCKLNGESLHCVWKVLTLILFDEKYCNVHIEMFWKIIPNQSFSGFSSINPFQTESFSCSNWTLFKLDKFFIKKVYKCF